MPSPRPLLLASSLALGLLAGCSSNPRPATTTPSTPAAESGGTPAATGQKMEAAPGGKLETAPGQTPELPSAESGGTPATAGEGMVAEGKATYYVKDSGVRCMAAPCPSFIARRADKPDEEGIPITDLDLATLGVTDAQRDRMLESTHDGSRGLKVEATIIQVPNAGPAGTATRLSVNRVLEGK